MSSYTYDAEYYRHSCGLPYERSPHWLNFFGAIADHIVSSLAPRRVLDAGCAMGFLVESLWDRGVEAWGVDISSFAISQVRADMGTYCLVGSIVDPPVSGSFDLVTCIEVLEHMPSEEADAAADRLCQFTDTILFSSTPSDLQEATHQNVHPIRGWIELFAKRGFYPDLLFDAQFLTPHAILFRRREIPPEPDALTFFARVLSARSLPSQQVSSKPAQSPTSEMIGALEREVESIQARMPAINELEQELASIQTRMPAINALEREVASIQTRIPTLEPLERELGKVKEQIEATNSDLLHQLRAEADRINQELGLIRAGLVSVDNSAEVIRLSSDVQELQRALGAVRAVTLQRSTEGEKLRVRLARIETAIDAANSRIDAILSSRTWRTLIRLGEVLLRAGDSWKALRRTTSKLVAGSGRSLFRRSDPDRDHIEIWFDCPEMGRESVLRQKMEIRGWTCARTGVKTIEIQLGDQPVTPIQTGITRNDVLQHLPDYLGSDRSGFKAELDCSQFPEGKTILQIKVTAASGLTRVIELDVIVDHRDEYAIWRTQNSPDNRRNEILANIQLFADKPLISIVTPVFKTPLVHLRACLDSVTRQYYSNWQHVLVDDGSNDPECRRMLEDAARVDSRVQVRFNAENAGIAAATNEAIAHAAGDFVAFLDHDDELSPDALYHIVKELNSRPDLDVFYSDEDKIAQDGHHFDAFFKPDWSPDLLHSVNYICHFFVCRRSLLRRVGGLRPGFEGSQDFDLALRLSEQTNLIRRIPKVLYHWRISPTSTALDIGVKPAASGAGLKALSEHLARTSTPASAVEIFPGHYRVRYAVAGRPRVSVIVPTGGNPLLSQALQGVLQATDYPELEILVIDNSKDDRVHDRVAKLRTAARPLRIVDCRGVPFNFSALCNRGARSTDAPYLLFLNDDTTVIHSDWLDAMLEHASRPEVGAVGNLLLFPDDRIQHAGVVMGLYGLAGHSFRLLDSRQSHYFHLPAVTRNCSAVTGACLLTRTEVFWEVGGFEEQHLPMAFQDVDLCLKLHERGYRIIYTPHAKLYHHESATKTLVAYPSEIEYMKQRWPRYIEDDPYYNPNLTRLSEGYGLNI